MKYIIEENTVDYSLSEHEHIIFHSNDEKLIIINRVAAIVWKHLENQKNIEEIAQVISEEFNEKDIAKIKKDILKFINELSDAGLVKKVEKND